ncbi:MAG: hypothetical protein U0271_02685 [Polyangiaceae bacterium]
MVASRGFSLVGFGALAFAACSAPQTADGGATERSAQPVGSAQSSASPATSRSEVAVAPKPSASASVAPEPSLACGSDADCGWDDPCMPKRCQSALADAGAEERECTKSIPPPGSCLCVEGACALKPSKPPPPVGPCKYNTCLLDRSRGECTVGEGGRGVRFTPANKPVGPACGCDAGQCQFLWLELVPCKRDTDCWVDRTPFLHPVKNKSSRAFKGCVDGETPPMCAPEGYCTVGPPFPC